MADQDLGPENEIAGSQPAGTSQVKDVVLLGV
jgi:hypothetical protein